MRKSVGRCLIVLCTTVGLNAHAESTYVLSDGIKIHFEEFGSGPPVILVPGWGGETESSWIRTGWVEALKDSHRVIALEPRGHGKSEKPHDQSVYSYSTMSRDVLAVMDHLEIETSDYVGYSMGACMGAYLLGHHSARFNAMVLGGIGDETPESIADVFEIAKGLRAKNLSDIEGYLGKAYRMYAESVPGNDLESLALSALQMWPEGYPLKLAGEGLAIAKTNVLVINGSNDLPYVKTDESFVKAIPNGELVRIPNLDHLGTMMSPIFREKAVDFLSKR